MSTVQGDDRLVSYVDAKQLALTMLPETPELSKFIGLQKLVHVLLGCTLDKAQQVKLEAKCSPFAAFLISSDLIA